MASIYDFSAKTIDGNEQKLDTYRGKTMLIVNVASKCGFTPQYEGLEALYRKFEGQGSGRARLSVRSVRASGAGQRGEIKNFCSLNYDVSFPMFAKIDVNGSATHPLYKYFKHEAKGVLGSEAIKWNFTKFLVDKDGEVVKRYAPADTPQRHRKGRRRSALKREVARKITSPRTAR